MTITFYNQHANVVVAAAAAVRLHNTIGLLLKSLVAVFRDHSDICFCWPTAILPERLDNLSTFASSLLLARVACYPMAPPADTVDTSQASKRACLLVASATSSSTDIKHTELCAQKARCASTVTLKLQANPTTYDTGRLRTPYFECFYVELLKVGEILTSRMKWKEII